jgi:hypothetical protein
MFVVLIILYINLFEEIIPPLIFIYKYLTSNELSGTIHMFLWYREVGHKSEVLCRLDSYKPDTGTL